MIIIFKFEIMKKYYESSEIIDDSNITPEQIKAWVDVTIAARAAETWSNAETSEENISMYRL